MDAAPLISGPESRSLSERIGGLLMAGFDGLEATNEHAEFFADLGGAVLFARNLASADQAAALVEGLQRDRLAAGMPPLIIATDQEGGTVARLAAFGTPIPSAMALGAARDAALTRAAYAVMGEELAALGITMDFAPVADLNSDPRNPVIGIRSFGEDPQAVSVHVRAAVEGLQAAGVAATAKHFPGHGDTSVDSHTALPVIERDAAQLRERELVPFSAAIAAGVDAIMSAHIAVPKVDAHGLPATLSRRALWGLLREQLRFQGVICTDCMRMDAVAALYEPGEAAVAALSAGADLVLFSSSPDAVRVAHRALKAALADGRLDAEAIERSLERVDALRRRYPSRRGSLAAIASRAHADIGLSCARKSVTLVRDSARVLPLRLQPGQRLFVAQFGGERGTQAENAAVIATSFGRCLAHGGVRVQEQVRSLDPAGHEYKQLLMAAGSADAIVAVTRRAFAHPLQARAVADLALGAKPLVVVAAREPYDATLAPADAAVIATYGDAAPTLEAAAEVILGAAPAPGVLPVRLAPGDASEQRAP